MSNILLYEPAMDYLTATSFNPLLEELVVALIDDLGLYRETQRFLQYLGEHASMGGSGSLFAGHGVQKGERHFLAKASGVVSHALACVILPLVEAGDARVTRCDIQVTVEESAGWSQLAFLNRLDGKGLNPEFKPSTDGESGYQLATVAQGNRRESPYYHRIYEKLGLDSAGGPVRLLRFECEIKKEMAQPAFYAAMQSKKRMQEVLLSRLEKLDDTLLNNELSCLFDAKPVKLRGIRNENDKRRDWYIRSIIPSLTRYLNETEDTQLCLEFASVVDDYLARFTE